MTNTSAGAYNTKFRLKPSDLRVILVLGDLLAAAIALGISLYVWASGDSWYQFSVEFLKYRAPAWFYLLPSLFGLSCW